MELTIESNYNQVKMPFSPVHYQATLESLIDNKKVFGAVASVCRGDDEWVGAAGDLKEDQPYFIASITKLYITAIILQLREIQKIKLATPVAYYIPDEILKDLHVVNGVDQTKHLTVKHLLAQTSGIPDYFEQKLGTGSSLKDAILKGEDRSWSFQEAIELAKQMPPKFKPGQRGKAFYSDTNFQLLGRIIEVLLNKPIAEVLQSNIFDVLGLENTYLYQGQAEQSPAEMYYKTKKLSIPKAMASFGPDGGIVSTAKENMIFLKAFFNGQLFPVDCIEELQEWNKINFPLQYGVGLAKFKMPWFFSPLRSVPELIGHSGLSGAFAYYCPEKDAYLAGTINQINHPDIAFKLMLKILGTMD